jgi:hypothetical protein
MPTDRPNDNHNDETVFDGDAPHECEFCSPPIEIIPAPWDRPGAEDPATWGTAPPSGAEAGDPRHEAGPADA